MVAMSPTTLAALSYLAFPSISITLISSPTSIKPNWIHLCNLWTPPTAMSWGVTWLVLVATVHSTYNTFRQSRASQSVHSLPKWLVPEWFSRQFDRLCCATWATRNHPSFDLAAHSTWIMGTGLCLSIQSSLVATWSYYSTVQIISFMSSYNKWHTVWLAFLFSIILAVVLQFSLLLFELQQSSQLRGSLCGCATSTPESGIIQQGLNVHALTQNVTATAQNAVVFVCNERYGSAAAVSVIGMRSDGSYTEDVIIIIDKSGSNEISTSNHTWSDNLTDGTNFNRFWMEQKIITQGGSLERVFIFTVQELHDSLINSNASLSHLSDTPTPASCLGD